MSSFGDISKKPKGRAFLPPKINKIGLKKAKAAQKNYQNIGCLKFVDGKKVMFINILLHQYVK